MKPLPAALLQQLEALPDETCRIVLNTNRQGHWEVEFTVRVHYQEPCSDGQANTSAWPPAPRAKATKARY
jgi:hypothetical protein